jgi:hypothetical protein
MTQPLEFFYQAHNPPVRPHAVARHGHPISRSGQSNDDTEGNGGGRQNLHDDRLRLERALRAHHEPW